MTDPNIDKAVEAATREIQRLIDGWMNYDDEDYTVLASGAIAAALPHVRAALADEIEAHKRSEVWSDHWVDGLLDAARIVRGED